MAVNGLELESFVHGPTHIRPIDDMGRRKPIVSTSRRRPIVSTARRRPIVSMTGRRPSATTVNI